MTKEPAKTFKEAAAKRMSKLTQKQKDEMAARLRAGLERKKKLLGEEAIRKQQVAAGKKGGKARAEKLTPKQRTRIAKLGGKAPKPRKGSDGESE